MTEFVEVKTSGLTGAELDWVVAQVEKVDGLVIHKGRPAFERDFDPDCWADETDLDAFKCWQFYTPSTDWSQGGPLIAEWRIDFTVEHKNLFFAYAADENGSPVISDEVCGHFGETHLISACRAIVASVLGGTVSVPKELLS